MPSLPSSTPIDYQPTPPYAVLPDGSKEPLQNCRFCGAMGFASFAHMHACEPVDELRSLLHSVLNAAHRDGGQYTTLAGSEVSTADAVKLVTALHKDNAALKARLDRLTRG